MPMLKKNLFSLFVQYASQYLGSKDNISMDAHLSKLNGIIFVKPENQGKHFPLGQIAGSFLLS